MSWQQAFIVDYNIKLKESRNEYIKYKETDRVIYLQQACNKLFSAVENYLIVKYNTRVKSYQDVLSLVKNNKNDKKLLVDASQLHYFYYNAELQMYRNEAEVIYKDVYSKMRTRAK